MREGGPSALWCSSTAETNVSRFWTQKLKVTMTCICVVFDPRIYKSQQSVIGFLYFNLYMPIMYHIIHTQVIFTAQCVSLYCVFYVTVEDSLSSLSLSLSPF